MKLLFKIFLCSMLLLFSCSAVQAAPKSLHHDLQVSLSLSENKISGLDSITLNPGQDSSLLFYLSKKAHVTRVEVNGRLVAFTFDGGRLHVPLNFENRAGQVSISIAYEGVFDDPVPESPLNTDNPGYGVTGVISEKGSFLQAGSGWYPEMPQSQATYRIRVDAPKGVLAVTLGKCLGHATNNGRTLSTYESKHPVEGLPLSAARYVVQEKAEGNVKAATYLFPRTAHLAGAYLDATIRYINLYENLFGPYPFDRFAVVENFFPTGYGFPSYTLLGSSVIRLPFIIATSLGHEIAHCWWGNGVYVDYENGNWSEALTTYVADYLYKERASPEEALEYRLHILRKFSILVTPEKDFPLREFQSRYDPASQAIGYGKGAMVFHMLRQALGEDVFWGALREVFRERLFQKTSWKDFQELFESHCQCSLRRFFQQWVYQKGAPLISLERVYSSRSDNAWRVSGFLVQERPLYALQLNLSLESGRQRVTQKIRVSNRETPFQIISDGPPERLIVDPDFDSFRRLYPQELPPSINAIKASPSVLIVITKQAGAGAEETARTLTLSLGLRRFQIVPEDQLNESAVRENDMVILGLPEKEELLSSLPLQVSVVKSGFAFKGKTFSDPSTVFFGVFAHPMGGDRVMALFLPLSTAYAGQVARKVTHYGKYSYLIFSQGFNQVKGIWSISESPLIYTWRQRGDQDRRE
jgi:aminopeptidase N